MIGNWHCVYHSINFSLAIGIVHKSNSNLKINSLETFDKCCLDQINVYTPFIHIYNATSGKS